MSSKKKPTRTGPRRRQNQAAQSSAPSPEPRQPRQLSRITVALVLVPVIGVFVYFASIVVREALNSPGTDPPTDPDRVVTQPVDAASVGSTVSWETADSRARDWDSIDDASRDGWNTEVFSDRATEQLNQLKKLLQHPESLDQAAVASLATEDISLDALRPSDPQQVYEDAVLRVYRFEADAENPPETNSGHAALIEQLQAFSRRYADPEQLRLKLKIFRVEQQDEQTITYQTVEAFGKKLDGGVCEENLVWLASWRDVDGQPRLASLQLDKYERSERIDLYKDRPLFSDYTASVFGDDRQFREQLLQGYNHWLARGQFKEFFSTLGNPGVAIGDVDNDGLEDLYLCQEAGLPNLLYVQQPDGTLKNESQASGTDWLQNSRSALIVDLDNDGNRDLAVAMTGGIVLASGDGSGRFEIREVLDTNEDILVLTAADYDLDGWLDLYAGAYFADKTGGESQDLPVGSQGGSFIYTDANNGGHNSLFRNQSQGGEWAFGDVTDATGLNVNNSRWTQGGAWADFDNDGDPDLYLASDYGVNNLYRNDLQPDGSRRFTDIAGPGGVEDSASGMSVAWGDYDCDGWLDLYVSNMYSYAGNRITFQNNFKPDAADETVERFQRFARGNSLLRNTGTTDEDNVQLFEDRSLEAAVNRGRWAWGSRFIDINNDGWEDIVVANGYVTTDDSGDL